jgi:lipoprotein signal peptidase
MNMVMDQILGGGVMNVIDRVTKGKSGKLINKVTKPIDSVKNAGKVLKNLF